MNPLSDYDLGCFMIINDMESVPLFKKALEQLCVHKIFVATIGHGKLKRAVLDSGPLIHSYPSLFVTRDLVDLAIEKLRKYPQH